MYDVLMTLACLTVVFGLGASILFILDRLTISSKESAQERTAALSAREGRWIKRFSFFMLLMAIGSLLASVSGTDKDQPMRLFYSVFAAAFIIFYIRSR